MIIEKFIKMGIGIVQKNRCEGKCENYETCHREGVICGDMLEQLTESFIKRGPIVMSRGRMLRKVGENKIA